MFCVPIFLQRTRDLSAVRTGVWMLPFGLGILVGAQVAGRIARAVGSVRVVQVGIAIEAAGLFVVAAMLTSGVTFLHVLLATSVFGFGVGCANSQLTNVLLSDVEPDKVGVAGGANSTVRQVTAALGIAIVGAVLSTTSARWALVVSGAVVAVGVIAALLIPHPSRPDMAELLAPVEMEPV
jgi:predicted MFS family arabinose efflux permease